MRLPGIRFAQSSFRRARSRLLGGIAVLGYHRVGKEDDDPFGLAVSVGRFAAQLDVLVHRACPISLSDALRALVEGTMPRRGVVLTFDDGYVDTLEQALPLIERAGVPATVFVCTGYQGREFWWDELTRLIMNSATLPATLEVVIGGRLRAWRLAERRPGTAARATRRAILTALANEVRVLRATEREDVMRVVRGWARQPGDEGSSRAPRALTLGELQRLAAHPQIEIGAHTVSHPVLDRLTHHDQREEIRQSRILLQSVTQKPVASFSYPHGSHSPGTLSLVKEAGFTAACCSRPDVVTRRSHPLALPRLWVTDQDSRSFAGWLDCWLHA